MEREQDIERLLSQYGRRLTFVDKLNRVHADLDMNAVREEAVLRQSRRPVPPMRQLWRNYRPIFAVAASVALLTTFATLFLVRYYRDTHSQQEAYSLLRRDVLAIKKSQSQILNGLSVRRRALVANPGQVAGSGFLLNTNGYLVTNNHIIQGSDSVYVQSQAGDVYKAQVIYANRSYDLAILRISEEDSAFVAPAQLPYGFDPRPSDLGERVFTLGYPRDEIVYGEGYLSAGTGYRNDSTAYQVAISVNPGNSGGPLLDERGNVIGIVSGKQVTTEGASFAIKTDYLYRAINAIAVDSLRGETLKLNRKTTLTNLPRKQQIKRVTECVYMVKVFKH